MIKKFYLLVTLGLALSSTEAFAQEAEGRIQKPYFIDYVMGPYLLIDNLQYDAFMMNGARLGFNFGNMNRFNFTIEYLAGHNSDVFGNHGMTHNANLGLSMYFKEISNHFDPYFTLGGGFLEFKEFTNDEYGIELHAGFGSSLQITKRVSGLLEARYSNTSLINVNGQNQLVVLWGARLGF